MCQIFAVIAAIFGQDDVLTTLQSWHDGFHYGDSDTASKKNDVEDMRLQRFREWTMPTALLYAVRKESQDAAIQRALSGSVNPSESLSTTLRNLGDVPLSTAGLLARGPGKLKWAFANILRFANQID